MDFAVIYAIPMPFVASYAIISKVVLMSGLAKAAPWNDPNVSSCPSIAAKDSGVSAITYTPTCTTSYEHIECLGVKDQDAKFRILGKDHGRGLDSGLEV